MALPKISAWRVTIEPHTVGRRYEIPRTEIVVYEPDEQRARVAAARAVHIRQNLPGWRPWLRQTYLRAQATRVLVEVPRGS